MSRFVPSLRGLRWAFDASMLMILSIGLVPASVTSAANLPAVVATIQDKSIAADELTTTLKGELLRLEMQRYKVLKEGLDDLIAKHLTEMEADKRQLSTEQLLQEEIVAKVKPVTPEQVKAFYEQNKARIKQAFEQIQSQIETYLTKQGQHNRRQAFVNELRQRYKVKIALPAPKVNVTADDDPVLGTADAPVTIIEFSDFQCPYCRQVQPALKQVLAEYEGKVRLVFRDFPLRNIHPDAQKAAEAAQCAGDQQQFWAYHDKLFEDNVSMKKDDLKKYAKALKLDMEKFTKCLDSGQYAKEVDDDLQDGQEAGVNSTPSFFVNGIPLTGAASYERFKELVDNALETIKTAKQAAN